MSPAPSYSSSYAYSHYLSLPRSLPRGPPHNRSWRCPDSSPGCLPAASPPDWTALLWVWSPSCPCGPAGCHHASLGEREVDRQRVIVSHRRFSQMVPRKNTFWTKLFTSLLVTAHGRWDLLNEQEKHQGQWSLDCLILLNYFYDLLNKQHETYYVISVHFGGEAEYKSHQGSKICAILGLGFFLWSYYVL